jgi:flagellar biosynthetic protein FliR
VTPLVAAYVGLVLARVGTFVAVLPPFAARTPRTVRAAFAIVLTAFYLAAAPPTWDAEFAKAAGDVHPLRYALALVREALIGASMGFVFALFLLPARIAGEFITAQIGLNAAPSISPSGPDGGGPYTVAFETAAGLMFLGLDGHHVALAALHASFAKFPLGGSGLPEFGPHLAALSSAYEAGMLLAGPLALCLFLLSVSLAIMTRVAPQLNVYSIGFTLQSIVALLGVLFLLPEIVRALAFALSRNADAVHPVLNGG